MTARLEILSGWKDIANYLRKGVRTAQRYERELRLPIHRPNRRSAGSVIATKAELDGWVRATPTRSASMPKYWLTERTNQMGAQFLQIDSDVALTFSGIALRANDEGTRSKTARTARNAYDTIIRLRKGIELTEAQRDKLDVNLQRLKIELQQLGQSF